MTNLIPSLIMVAFRPKADSVGMPQNHADREERVRRSLVRLPRMF
jgi:hypothetical protein